MLIDHGLLAACHHQGGSPREQEHLPKHQRPNNSWELDELDHAMRYMRSTPGSNGKVAVIGFGHGGQQAYLAACRLKPEAAIIYHGTSIDDFLEEGRHIDCETVFHMGNDDPYMTDETDRKIHAALIGKFNIAI